MQNYCASCCGTVSAATLEACPSCSAKRPRWGWPEDPRLGELIAGDQYRVLRRVGAGGFGVVYEVETIVGGLRRALKVLSSEWVADEEMRERFVNELAMLERVNHPNVGRCYAAGELEEDGTLYMLLELVEGRTLTRVLEDDGRPLDPRRAVPMARQIASGLVAAHANGVLHRDLKPDNIMVVREDDVDALVKVVDFGVAKQMHHGAAVTMSVVGTPQFMAPEQYTPGVSLDARVDVWQLGATLFMMLTGRPPFTDDNATLGAIEQHANHVQAGPKPSTHMPTLVEHHQLDTLVSSMLATDPLRRPKSAAEVCDRLARIEHDLSPYSAQTSSRALLDTLCSQPSDGAWWSICRFLQNRKGDRDMLVGLADQRLSGWSYRLRRAPSGWWERVKRDGDYAVWPIVRALDLSSRPLTREGVEELAQSASFRSLAYLNLSGCGIDNEGAALLAQSPNLANLRHLDLSNNKVSSAGAIALLQSTELSRLTHLDLSSNGLGPRAAEALASTRLPLKSLLIADNDIRRDGAQALAAGEGLRQLRELTVSGNSLGPDGAAAIATSKVLSALEQLDLSDNEIGPAGAATLALSPMLASLRRLRLAQNGLGPRGLELLITSGRSDALEELDLSSNEIDASGAMALASSPFARRLRSLELADNQLTDAGLVVLLGSSHMAGLQFLGVAQNSLTDSALRLMTAAPPQLESLDISRNAIGPAGAHALASALPRTRLMTLALSGCDIDGESVVALLRSGNGRLQGLDLSGNALGADGIEVIAQTTELSAVRELDVSNNELGKRGAGRLGTSTFLTGLRKLVLAKNNIGDEGVELLARSASNMPLLQTLSLSDNRLGPKGVSHLGAFAARMGEIDLSFNELGDSGVTALARTRSWDHLTDIDLTNSGIGFGGFSMLVASPNLPTICSITLTRNALFGELDVHCLSKDKAAILQETFAHVVEQGSDVAELFYARLFLRYPAVKPLFANLSMSAQRRHLTAALVMTIDNISDGAALEAMLTELGARHLGYGVALTHYFAVTSTLLDVLKEAAGPVWTDEVHDVWHDALEAIATVMMRAHRELERTGGFPTRRSPR